MKEFLSLWQESKHAAQEKFAYRVSQLPYRSNWYWVRRAKKPKKTWPDEVRAWRSFRECVSGSIDPFISQGNVENIRDQLLSLHPTENEIRIESDPNLHSIKRNWAYGSIDEHKRIFCYFVRELQPWIQSRFELPSEKAASAGASVYVCVLSNFLPIGKIQGDYFRSLSIVALIRLLLDEGHSGMTILKITQTYHSASMQELHKLILQVNGGVWPRFASD